MPRVAAPNSKWASRYPVESFDPRLKEVLLKGATTKFSLTFATPGLAHTFQRRIHTFRSRCKQADVEDWKLMYRCATSRKDNMLTLRPYDSAFTDVLAAAGFEETTAPLDIDFDPVEEDRKLSAETVDGGEENALDDPYSHFLGDKLEDIT